ncbi:ribonuclease H-like domain-containing protein, partial [Tanacetum coccineum]
RNQDNNNKESSRRSVPVETSTSTTLVSCDGLGGYDWSDQAKEGTNYALMAYSSLSPDSEVSNDSICLKSCLETVKLLKYQNGQLLKDLKKSELMVLAYKIDEFVNEPVVENCKAMSSEEEPKVVRKHDDTLSIEEWVSDDKEKDVSQPKTKKKIVRPRNVSYLTDYEEIDGGYVTFERNPKRGKITGKGHLNFKTMNKLVKENLVRGLPSKLFENDQTYVACQKGKQHRASYHKVKVIRCDNETEFKNREMNQFCEMKGILRQLSIARTPQQNGVSERRNRTLIEATRTMLADSKLPTTFWGRSCKFDGKADEGFFVGYSLNSKAFRVFNSRTRIVEENLHIRFSESTPNVVGSGPDWLFDIYALTRTMNYEPIVAGTRSNGFADPKSSHYDGSKPSSDDGKKVDEDLRKDSECKDQEKEDNVNNTNNVNIAGNVNTISLTINVAGTNKVNFVGEKIGIKLPFDLNMPALEDDSIFDLSRDDEDDGAVADMNNLDTTIQVSPNPTTRIHKDHPLDQVIRDL